MKKRLFFTLFLFALIVGAIWQPAHAQVRGEYFWQTGHNLLGDFLDAYYQVPNPLLVYGYPITDAFFDISINRTVQYFQRARFELILDAPAGSRVMITPVGDYTYEKGDPLPLQKNAAGCRTFTQRGFQVCYAFLEFFDKYGGEAQFGYPISNFEFQNGRVIQYFQYARFEWHPERAVGEHVTLADLGKEYFDLRKEKPFRLRPQQVFPGIIDFYALGKHAEILELKVQAYPKFAVIALNGQQAVHVAVRDQLQKPVANAQVEIELNPPIILGSPVPVPPTNAQGLTSAEFTINAFSIGLVEVKVAVSIYGLEGSTLTSFRVWW